MLLNIRELYTLKMITKSQIATGVVHEVPDDLYKALVADDSALERWEDLTPLARNEWICWTITCKKPETRTQHVDRVVVDLLKGKRRPCCWIGCTHRPDRVVKAYTKGYEEKK